LVLCLTLPLKEGESKLSIGEEVEKVLGKGALQIEVAVRPLEALILRLRVCVCGGWNTSEEVRKGTNGRKVRKEDRRTMIDSSSLS